MPSINGQNQQVRLHLFAHYHYQSKLSIANRFIQVIWKRYYLWAKLVRYNIQMYCKLLKTIYLLPTHYITWILTSAQVLEGTLFCVCCSPLTETQVVVHTRTDECSPWPSLIIPLRLKQDILFTNYNTISRCFSLILTKFPIYCTFSPSHQYKSLFLIKWPF